MAYQSAVFVSETDGNAADFINNGAALVIIGAATLGLSYFTACSVFASPYICTSHSCVRQLGAQVLLLVAYSCQIET